jgi:hypothetical protein
MNETQLIRAQLGTEQAHAGAVALACAQALRQAPPQTLESGAPLEQFRQACVDYLVCILAWYEERDRRLGLLVQQLASDDPRCRALNEALAGEGTSRHALERLEAALAGQDWQGFVDYFTGPWRARREALETLLDGDSRPADWRMVGGIDADGILEERTRYARVAAALPAGISLAAVPARTS